MVVALKQRLQRSQIDAANARVLSVLNGYDRSAASPICPQGMRASAERCEASPGANGNCKSPAWREGELCVAAPKHPASAKLAVVNALMLPGRGELVSEPYQALLEDNYGAEILRNATLEDINAWVSRKTAGKIEKILDRVDPDTAAVLLNAVYFKAKWASAFGKSATRDDTFNLTSAQKVPVPMMRNVGAYDVVARDGYRAIRLPYEVSALGMIIVLPDAIDGVGEVGGRLDAQELPQLFAALNSRVARRPNIAMPRFKASFKAELAKPFQQAGMIRAFNPKEADFSGMTGRTWAEAPLAISEIVHRAAIEVMEDGTEAAAASAIAMLKASAPPRQSEVFRVDRPFLFYLVDDATGAILFQGRIVDPR